MGPESLRGRQLDAFCTVKSRFRALCPLSFLPLPTLELPGGGYLGVFVPLEGAFVHFTSSPLYSPQENSPLLAQPVIVLCIGRFQKSRPLLALVWIFALLQNSQMASLAFFRLPFHPPLLARFLESSRKFPESLPAKSARLSANRGAPGIPARGAYATRPGFSPLRAQFRFGVANDWSSFLFLGLGEFWCEHVGSFIKK